MGKRTWKYKIIAATMAIGLSLWAGTLKAQTTEYNQFSSIRSPAASSLVPEKIQAVTPGSSESVRRQIFLELLSTETPSLSWPAFPRIWLETSRTEMKTSNTSLGFRVPVLSTGAKLSIHFRYGLKTTLVVMASMRRDPKAAPANAPLVAPNPVGKAEEFHILRWDEQQSLNFPDVKEGHPMIAFCSFEASLGIDKHGEAGFDILGNGQSVEYNDVDNTSYTLFSNFFQVRPDIPIKVYKEEICGNLFREGAEQFVINDFSKIVLEKVIHSNPKSTCTPDSTSTDLDSRLSDTSCMAWHASEFSKVVRNMTVARCALRGDGSHRCELRSKENMNCSIYENADGVRSDKRAQIPGQPQPITHGRFEFDCDEKQGLRCVMESEPWKFGSIPVWPGRASCRR